MTEKEKDLQAGDSPPEQDEIVDAEVIEEASKAEPVEAESAEAEEPPMAEAEHPEEPVQAAPKRPSALPLVLGGVVAGAIGFAGGFALQGGWLTGGQTDQVAALEVRISDLEQGLAALETGQTDFANAADIAELDQGVQGRIQALSSDLGSQIEALTSTQVGLEERLTTQVDRLTELEKRPMEAALSEDVVAAYEQEMAGLRAAISQHRQEIEAMAAEARAAEAEARRAEGRVALAGLLADLEQAAMSGQPFGEELAAVADASASAMAPSLTAAAGGITALADLQDSFPTAARAALSAQRQADAQQGGRSGLWAFVQDQLGARSVAPKDGDSVDAVLSRAEAALRLGDVDGALGHLEALPEVAQPAVADWVAQATQRQTVLDDINALSAQLGQ